MRILLFVALLILRLVGDVSGIETPNTAEGETVTDESVKDASGEEKQSAESEAITLTLEESVELALRQNRRFLREEEALILEYLSYEVTRHNYGPLLSGTVSSEIDQDDSTTQTAEASLTKRLFTGGDLSLSGSSSDVNGGDSDQDYFNSVLSLNYVQPLLKDAGRLVSQEELTSAKRELTYARRSLVLFRQEFLISIIRQYYRLLQQASTIKNQEKKVENAALLLKRSQAQMDRGKASPIDVYRAELALLQAENQLIDARDLYRLGLDEFKIDLGIPPEEVITVEDKKLEWAPLDKDIGTYVRLALANRLDLETASDSVEDSRRNLEIARNRLRSRLDLGFALQTSTDPVERFSEQEFGDAEWTVGLEYEIPFDRLSERTDYRRQLIDYLRKVREREQLRDRVIVEVRSVIRDMRKAETTLEIQKRNIDVAEKQLDRARSDYDRGTITNRDVVDALNDLTDARNKYEEATVDYTVAGLELLRVAGVLDFENWRNHIK